MSEDEAPRSDDTYSTLEELVTDVIMAIDNSSINEANGINPPGVPLVDVVSDGTGTTSSLCEPCVLRSSSLGH